MWLEIETDLMWVVVVVVGVEGENRNSSSKSLSIFSLVTPTYLSVRW